MLYGEIFIAIIWHLSNDFTLHRNVQATWAAHIDPRLISTLISVPLKCRLKLFDVVIFPREFLKLHVYLPSCLKLSPDNFKTFPFFVPPRCIPLIVLLSCNHRIVARSVSIRIPLHLNSIDCRYSGWDGWTLIKDCS